MLKLNDDKIEAILCGSKTQQSKVSVNSIWVGESELSLCSLVIDLGLLIDSNITLHYYISAVVFVRTCYFELCVQGKLRPFLTANAAISVTVAQVISR